MFKYIILLLVFSLNVRAQDSKNKCIKAEERIKLPEEMHEINYARLSPDGQYVMGSFDEKVYLLQLLYSSEGYKTKIYKTPLSEEAYPVEPDCEC